MINNQMFAIIKKDLRGMAANRRMLVTLLAVPAVLTIFIPSVFILTFSFIPEGDPDLQKLPQLMPSAGIRDTSLKSMIGFMLNYILPTFFLIIPIMASSVMAAVSFIGEKEKRTLETLLYCPLSLSQIFRAKVLAAFLLSMLVSAASFAVMITVLETEALLTAGAMVLPDVKWLLVMLLVSPSFSLIAVTLIVRFSARAQSVEDAQQGAVFLLLPVILLLVGQFTGILLVSAWILLAIGTVCALTAVLLLKKSVEKFRYETLLFSSSDADFKTRL